MNIPIFLNLVPKEYMQITEKTTVKSIRRFLEKYKVENVEFFVNDKTESKIFDSDKYDNYNLSSIWTQLKNPGIYLTVEPLENIRNWIIQANMKDITLENIINLLSIIEEKTKNTNKRIIFYGEDTKGFSSKKSFSSKKGFSSNFLKKTSKRKAGFASNSFFVGIVGSMVVECILEPNRLKEHINNETSIDKFMLYVYNNYEKFSTIFNLDDSILDNILDDNIWSVERLKKYV